MRLADLGTRTLVAGAVVLTAVTAALVLQDLTHANRPHELHFVPHVALLSLGNAAVGLELGRRLFRWWRSGPGWSPLLATAAFAPYAGIVALVGTSATFETVRRWFG